MAVILETSADRQAESFVANRLEAMWPYQIDLIQAPKMALLDYFVSKSNEITGGLEIRTRKQTAKEIQGYGGLMLKLRKLKDLQHLSLVLNMPIHCIFAFEEGYGDIYSCKVDGVPDLPAQTPPRRRNFRNVQCDLDPVIFLDWDKYLIRLA